MANSSSDVDSLASKLQSTSLPKKESGVSVVGKSLKLNDAQDAQTIVDELNSLETVEFLNMEGNSLGVAAAKEISKALEKRKEFKKALWKDMFTSRLKTEIPQALKHLTGSLMLAGARLEVLDLSDNASGPIGVEGFEDFLRSPSCYTLRELRLNNMGLGISGAKKLASALLDLYNNSKNAGEPLKLEVFIAGRNRLENQGATALAQVFQKIGTLKEISIPQNGIYHVGITALSSAFNENTSLEVINLNDNTLTEIGARALSKVLGKLTNLKVLDLGDCILRSGGALAIAESLSSLRNLQTLNLSFDEVRGEVGCRLIEILSPLASCLSSLNMDGNMFGPTVKMELESKAKELKLPLGSLSDDEGDDDDDDDDDDDAKHDDDDELEEEEEEEEDEELDDDEEESMIGEENKNVENGLEISTDGISFITSHLESLSVNSPMETDASTNTHQEIFLNEDVVNVINLVDEVVENALKNFTINQIVDNGITEKPVEHIVEKNQNFEVGKLNENIVTNDIEGTGNDLVQNYNNVESKSENENIENQEEMAIENSEIGNKHDNDLIKNNVINLVDEVVENALRKYTINQIVENGVTEKPVENKVNKNQQNSEVGKLSEKIVTNDIIKEKENDLVQNYNKVITKPENENIGNQEEMVNEISENGNKHENNLIGDNKNVNLFSECKSDLVQEYADNSESLIISSNNIEENATNLSVPVNMNNEEQSKVSDETTQNITEPSQEMNTSSKKHQNCLIL